MVTQLVVAQVEAQGLFPLILTSTINAQLKTGVASRADFQGSLHVALSCELWLPRAPNLSSQLEETEGLCLDICFLFQAW